jgi:hypothetical protein
MTQKYLLPGATGSRTMATGKKRKETVGEEVAVCTRKK